MTDTYAAAKEQLDEIVQQVRKKDVSLERSLDLLEEGVALANRCTEFIDQAAWESADDEVIEQDVDESEIQKEAAEVTTEESAVEDEPFEADTDA